jgi:hypothetical protein
MPVRTVFEIYRQTVHGPVAIGLVADGFLSQQIIDRLYEELRQHIFTPTGLMRLGELGFTPDVITGAADWDIWSVNDRNSPTPTFFSRPKYLWNNVPSHLAGFIMVEAGDEFGAFAGDIPNVIAELPPKP